MRKVISKHFDIITNLLARRYKTLLFSLIAMIILPSLFKGSEYQNIISFALNTITIFLCIYAIQESKTQLYWGSFLAFVVTIINQFGLFRGSVSYDFYFSFIIYLLFYAYVAYRLLKMILVTANVGSGVLFAAVIVYLLIGVIGAYLFMLIENASPGSINNLKVETLTNPNNFFYFSFTTLSTLGYGDITPVSAQAKSISIVLSTTGPLYLTVLVALLVSRFEHSDIH